MKLMKFFLLGALTLSTVAPSLSGMEAINRYLNSAPQEQPATVQEIENAQDCSICQDGLTNGPAIRALRCNPAGVPHIYHRRCINDWLISRQIAGQPAACPACQNPAVPEISRKEQFIANVKGLEYRHNPLNQNNRSLTARLATFEITTKTSIMLGIFVLIRYYFPHRSYKEIFRAFLNSRESKLAIIEFLKIMTSYAAAESAALYGLLKYTPNIGNGDELQDRINSRSMWITWAGVKVSLMTLLVALEIKKEVNALKN